VCASNGGAKVTAADIEASNGIVHVIDAVLKLPTIVSQIKQILFCLLY
jgi:uncharacterized surface protein with fasciclin (FAS1) repeats